MTITKADIENFLAEGDVQQALDGLRAIAETSVPKLRNDLVLQSGRWKSLQRDQIRGIMAKEDAQVETARIASALLDLLNKVPADATAELPSAAPTRGAGFDTGGGNGNATGPQNPVKPQDAAPALAGGRKTILMLASNPAGTTQLRLDQEARDIAERLRRANQRDDYQLLTRWAVRTNDLVQYLLDEKPQIVHFSGHGTGEEGLVLEDNSGQMKLVSSGALSRLFKNFPSVECVVLNACYAEVQADAIVEHIPYVIGMRRAVPDETAVLFASTFYSALASGGVTLPVAFEIACAAIDIDSLPGSDIPVLKVKAVV